MPCLSCQSSNVDYKDNVLLCQSCGAVLEDVPSQDNNFISAPRNIEYNVKTKKNCMGKLRVVCMVTTNYVVLMLFCSIPE